jgi:hypothetical protein
MVTKLVNKAAGSIFIAKYILQASKNKYKNTQNQTQK